MANIRYKVGDTWYDVGSMGGSISEITVDSQLSDTSANPVENRVITKALEDSKEVSVSSTTPTGDEVLWINPDGTGGGSSSGGGGKLYRHRIDINKTTDDGPHSIILILYATHNTAITINNFSDIGTLFGFLPLDSFLFIPAWQYKAGKNGLCAITFGFISPDEHRVLLQAYDGYTPNNTGDHDQYVIANGDATYTITDTVTEL